MISSIFREDFDFSLLWSSFIVRVCSCDAIQSELKRPNSLTPPLFFFLSVFTRIWRKRLFFFCLLSLYLILYTFFKMNFGFLRTFGFSEILKKWIFGTKKIILWFSKGREMEKGVRMKWEWGEREWFGEKKTTRPRPVTASVSKHFITHISWQRFYRQSHYIKLRFVFSLILNLKILGCFLLFCEKRTFHF